MEESIAAQSTKLEPEFPSSQTVFTPLTSSLHSDIRHVAGSDNLRLKQTLNRIRFKCDPEMHSLIH